MTRTNWLTLIGVAIGVTSVGWAILRLWTGQGMALISTPWTIPVIFAALAVTLFIFGWSVRQYLRGNRPDVSGLRAARTAAFAKTASFVGAAFAGWYGATVLVITTSYLSEFRKEQAVIAGIAVLTAILLSVVGYVVEGYCRLPPPGTEDKPEFPDQLGRA